MRWHKTRKSPISFTPVRPSGRMYQFSYRWTDVNDIWYWELLHKYVQKTRFWLKSDRKYPALNLRPKCVYTVDSDTRSSTTGGTTRKRAQCHTAMQAMLVFLCCRQWHQWLNNTQNAQSRFPDDYTNAPRCYVKRTLPNLLNLRHYATVSH
jgi:hypothetical protein